MLRSSSIDAAIESVMFCVLHIGWRQHRDLPNMLLTMISILSAVQVLVAWQGFMCFWLLCRFEDLIVPIAIPLFVFWWAIERLIFYLFRQILAAAVVVFEMATTVNIALIQLFLDDVDAGGQVKRHVLIVIRQTLMAVHAAYMLRSILLRSIFET